MLCRATWASNGQNRIPTQKLTQRICFYTVWALRVLNERIEHTFLHTHKRIASGGQAYA